MREREYDEVLDDLTGLQAKLRGEEPPPIASRRVLALPVRAEAQTTPDAIPRLRLERTAENLSVSHEDLTVLEDPRPSGSADRPSVRPERNPGDAWVIQMPMRGDDRTERISERLERLEMELTDVLHGLEDTEQLLDRKPVALPMEESTGDPLIDLQRLVARRLESDPEA